MGEIADMMLEGGMCQWCGEILDGDGFPTICAGCQAEEGVDQHGNKPTISEGQKRRRHQCNICSKGFRTIDAMNQHGRDKHGTDSIRESA